MSSEELTIEELVTKLAAVEADQQALQKALQVKQQQGKKEFIQSLRDQILAKGYDLAEIAGSLAGKRRAANQAGYPVYADPENPKNTYARGVLPGWLKERMREADLDPSNKQDRESFKANYLVQQAA